MRAAVTFVGAIGDKLRTFTKGDTITKAEAEEMGLADKPWLVTADKKGADHGTKIKES